MHNIISLQCKAILLYQLTKLCSLGTALLSRFTTSQIMFATAVLCSSSSVSCSVAADDVQTDHSDDIAFTTTTTTTKLILRLLYVSVQLGESKDQCLLANTGIHRINIQFHEAAQNVLVGKHTPSLLPVKRKPSVQLYDKNSSGRSGFQTWNTARITTRQKYSTTLCTSDIERILLIRWLRKCPSR